MVIAAAVGLGYQRPLLIAIAEAGFVGVLLLFLYAARASRGIQIERTVNTRVVEEDDVAVQLRVQCTTRLPVYAVQITDWFTPQDESEKKLLIESLSPRRPSSAIYVGHCSRGRGLYELGPLTVSVSDPLGFFIREQRFDEPTPILVLPRTLPVSKLELSGLRTDAASTAENVTRVGSSPLFFGTREYRPGDNVRYIHWRSSARWGRLVLKEFEALANREVTVYLDLDRSSGKGVLGQQNVELAIHLAASIIEYATQTGLPVQLVGQAAQEVHIPLGTGAAHLSVMMETLATVTADGSSSYTDMILSRLPLFPEGSTAALILNHLDYEPSAIATCAATLARKNGRVIAVIIDDGRFVRFRPRDAAQTERRMTALEDALVQAGATVYPIRAGVSLGRVFAPEHEVRV
jgi:uncharacterized protein (DUF58 family)